MRAVRILAPRRRGRALRAVIVGALCYALLLPGCTSFCRRELAVPAPQMPPHILDAPRSSRVPVNYLALRLDPPREYRIGPEDVLGLYIEGVLGDPETVPPVHTPQQEHLPPAIGFPVTVREDGTIALPQVAPVSVAGMTLFQAEETIRSRYVERRILEPGRDRVIVTMLRLRTYHVLVIRQDAGPALTAGRVLRPGEVLLEPEKQGRAFALELPAYRNDLLHALTETGGVPGADAQPYVVILRGREFNPSDMRDGRFMERLRAEIDRAEPPSDMPDVLFMDEPHSGIAGAEPIGVPGAIARASDRPGSPDYLRVLRIPLMTGPGLPPMDLSEEQITLQDGDVVVVESRESEVFYTGGLLEGGQHPIPRDYDLDVLGAIAMAGGSVAAAAGGSGTVRFGGAAGTVFPPTRVTIVRLVGGVQVPIEVDLKRALIDPSERVLIQPNDFILLEYTRGEAIANLMLNNVLVSLTGSLWD